jgi:hypothetical protein
MELLRSSSITYRVVVCVSELALLVYKHSFVGVRLSTHPVSCAVGMGSFPGVKKPELGADQSFPSNSRL